MEFESEGFAHSGPGSGKNQDLRMIARWSGDHFISGTSYWLRLIRKGRKFNPLLILAGDVPAGFLRPKVALRPYLISFVRLLGPIRKR